MLFLTHHHQFQRARADYLPVSVVRWKTHGLGRAGVVGAFIRVGCLHGASLVLLFKKGITNVCEKFVVVRNAHAGGGLWIA